MTTRWSELDIIRRIKKTAGLSSPGLVLGIGDDCAIIDRDSDTQLLVTTDMLVEDVHFSRLWHPPHELGRKSVAVNISDIAAMGGVPQYVFLSLCLPDSIDQSWLNHLLNGVDSMMVEHGCCLAGGDTVRGERVTINVTLIGKVTSERAVRRDTADRGQSVFVSGFLGSAAAGLLLFQSSNSSALIDQQVAKPFLDRHLNPTPDVHYAKLLSESGLVTSMQDISDGVATDLSHICAASSIGAEIDESLLPFHPDLPRVATALECNLTELLVAGGEDYHLIFTIHEGRDNELFALMKRHGLPVFRIGKTIEKEGVFLRLGKELKEITFGGFEH